MERTVELGPPLPAEQLARAADRSYTVLLQERGVAAPQAPSVSASSADEPAPAAMAPETDDGWFTAAALSATKRAQP